MNGERIAAFISIPKNASHTVRHILQLGPNRDRDDTASLVIYENHQRGVVLKARHDLRRLFTFCFARNPYDRCVSWFEYHRRHGTEPYASLSFADWVMAGLPHHWRRQNGTDYVAEGLSPLLQYQFVARTRLDFIGRIETFATDLKRVIAELNRRCRAEAIPHRFVYSPQRINASDRSRRLRDFYSIETKRRVRSLLRKDFEFFGYEP
jgi:hypothetical protein